ncbi:c-type cytochrome [Desulfosediminicola flagellatus]|uniref:c-type cytochrome n=1 Tax=Desulfosediminicola flagellatus TaxID=2569541 RepID=UPI0010AB7A6E|nr:cytochrome c [Desulfosediminicola flagellatus]
MLLSLKKYAQHILTGACVAVAISGIAMAHEWMAPKDAAAVKNPVNLTKESSANGKAVFLDNCSACHGENAEGLNAQEAGQRSNTPNLKKRLATHSDGDFFWKIKKGRGDMPAFEDNLEEQEIWDVINYLKSEN